MKQSLDFVEGAIVTVVAKCLFLFAGIAVATPCPLAAKSQPAMRSMYRPIGSAPPQQAVSTCIDDLYGRPYDEALVASCLKTISALPFARRTWIRKAKLRSGRVLVEFNVESPELRIDALTFRGDPGQELQLRRWLELNPATLRLGETFTADGASATWSGIQQFYLARGVIVGITPFLKLDYTAGSALIDFAIVVGAKTPPSTAIPPYGPLCQDPIMAADESQMDDHVPRLFVESQITLYRAYACYSPDAARAELQTLQAIPVIDSAEVKFGGRPGNRHVSYMIKGKPLKIRHLNVQAYGTSAPCLLTAQQGLKMHSGDIYSRSLAYETVDDLQKRCKDPRYYVDVSEEETPVGTCEIDIVFNVLAVPSVTLIINGVTVP